MGDRTSGPTDADPLDATGRSSPSDRPGSSEPSDLPGSSEPSDPTGSPGEDDGSPPDGKKPRPAWRELPVMVIAALLIAILIKTFLVQAFFIPSPSMRPGLQEGDRILVCRVCLRFQPIEQGDVLVFALPNGGAPDRGPVGGFLHWLGEAVGVAHPDDPDFVKRVGALPGQTWEIRRGELFVDGERIEEPYLHPNTDDRSYGPATVPDGMLLMLGDNRLESGDSRFGSNEGGLGYVPVDSVVGKVFVKVWPPSRWGWTP